MPAVVARTSTAAPAGTDRPADPTPGRRPRWWFALGALERRSLTVGGLSAAVLVGSGSPGWVLVRVAVVLGVVAGTMWLVAERPHVGRWAMLAGAALGIAAGIGIGVRHLLVAGLGITTIAGLATLAAGLGLLTAGVRGVVRGSGRRRHLVVVPSLILAVGVAVWILTPGILATNVPPTEIDDVPADVGLDAEDVVFTTADGVELAAWWIPSEDGAAVVVRHGAGSTRSDSLQVAEVLAGNGYGVLVTDARGHGDSGGRAMDFGWYGDADIRAAVSFVAGRPGVDPGRIAVLGRSMGGEEALGAVAADARIAAVVAEGATARTAGDKEWLSDEYGLRGSIQRGIEWLQYGWTDVLTAASPPTLLAEAARLAAPRPILLVAAGELPDEQHAADHIRAAAPGSVEVWVVPDSGHTGGLEVAPTAWEDTVVGFLDGALDG